MFTNSLFLDIDILNVLVTLESLSKLLDLIMLELVISKINGSDLAEDLCELIDKANAFF